MKESEDREEWKILLTAWAGLEMAGNFECKVGALCSKSHCPLTVLQQTGLSPAGRPVELGVWIQNARIKPLVIKNRETYAARWWNWWDTINPPWRERRNKRPVSGGSGDWSAMVRTGLNGFLTVLESLVALHNIADSTAWREALVDVRWVVQEVTHVASR